VIICGHINLLPAAVAARRMTGADLYLIVHGIDAWHPTRDPITNACVRSIDDFISVSAVTRRRFLRWSGLRQDHGVVLPNCVDLSAFKPSPRSTVLVDRYQLKDSRVLLTLGRIASEERYKGFDEIIECLPDISPKIPGITYMIAGDGPDRPRLVDKAISLGLRVDDYVDDKHTPGTGAGAPRVIFVGRISEQDKPDYIRLADLFVMPSSGEGFGIVLLEAMACGVPVIASKIDASREALREGKLGTLVDPRHPSEIKAAIIDGLSREADRTRAVSGVEYFSVERFEERVHAVLRSIRHGPAAMETGGDAAIGFTRAKPNEEQLEEVLS
jgi:glycosyltransferase involved in cell wall biosynthesis